MTLEKGQGLVEYALIILLIALVLIVVLAAVGSQLNEFFERLIAAIP